MGSVRLHPARKTLFLDYRVGGKRHREYTSLPDTPGNRAKLQRELTKIEAGNPGDIVAPAVAVAVEAPRAHPSPVTVETSPTLEAFAPQWLQEHAVEWRRSHLHTIRCTLSGHLVPAFGAQQVGMITREDVLQFRTALAQKPGRRPGSRLSNKRINAVMAVLKQMLDEAALRYQFVSPAQGIKRLKLRRTDVQPFSLQEVQLLLQTVRSDYRDYLLVRCFTGMRSGEVDGLQWKYVDFERRQILIRETRVLGEDEYTKTDSSQRHIQMSTPVYEALRRQEAITRQLSKYVFCNREGNPIDNKNFVDRVWNPLLRHLGLALRRPYQMRHTAATLWLGAGENPEWVARQLGHATTEMLFKVYSRYVPNLTRQDGSAFDRLIQSRL